MAALPFPTFDWEPSEAERAEEEARARDAWRKLEQRETPPSPGVGTLLSFLETTPFHRSDVLFPRMPGWFKRAVFDEEEP